MGWIFHLEIVVSKAANHSVKCNLSLPSLPFFLDCRPCPAVVLVIDSFHSNQDFHYLMKSVEIVKLLTFSLKYLFSSNDEIR